MSAQSQFLIPGGTGASALHCSVPLKGETVIAPVFVDLRPFGIEYAVAKYPVTNAIYQSHLAIVSKKNLLFSQAKLIYVSDKRFAGPDRPAVGVSYRDALGYCDWMADRFSEKFQLPDVETWERIASCNKRKMYSTITDQCTGEYANFGLEVGGTTPVNAYPPNEFGLHDMTGNVLEWTTSPPTVANMRPEFGGMPIKTEKDLAGHRVLKGGNWAFDAANSRISATIILAVTSVYYVTGFRPVIYLG
jgi:formylglycine-generating enzyme required for sulfatase activity